MIINNSVTSCNTFCARTKKQTPRQQSFNYKEIFPDSDIVSFKKTKNVGGMFTQVVEYFNKDNKRVGYIAESMLSQHTYLAGCDFSDGVRVDIHAVYAKQSQNGAMLFQKTSKGLLYQACIFENEKAKEPLVKILGTFDFLTKKAKIMSKGVVENLLRTIKR